MSVLNGSEVNRILESTKGDREAIINGVDVHWPEANAVLALNHLKHLESMEAKDAGQPTVAEQLLNPQGQGMPPQGQGMPPQGQGMPPQGQGMPPQGQGMPQQMAASGGLMEISNPLQSMGSGGMVGFAEAGEVGSLTGNVGVSDLNIDLSRVSKLIDDAASRGLNASEDIIKDIARALRIGVDQAERVYTKVKEDPNMQIIGDTYSAMGDIAGDKLKDIGQSAVDAVPSIDSLSLGRGQEDEDINDMPSSISPYEGMRDIGMWGTGKPKWADRQSEWDTDTSRAELFGQAYRDNVVGGVKAIAGFPSWLGTTVKEGIENNVHGPIGDLFLSPTEVSQREKWQEDVDAFSQERENGSVAPTGQTPTGQTPIEEIDMDALPERRVVQEQAGLGALDKGNLVGVDGPDNRAVNIKEALKNPDLQASIEQYKAALAGVPNSAMTEGDIRELARKDKWTMLTGLGANIAAGKSSDALTNITAALPGAAETAATQRTRRDELGREEAKNAEARGLKSVEGGFEQYSTDRKNEFESGQNELDRAAQARNIKDSTMSFDREALLIEATKIMADNPGMPEAEAKYRALQNRDKVAQQAANARYQSQMAKLNTDFEEWFEDTYNLVGAEMSVEAQAYKDAQANGRAGEFKESSRRQYLSRMGAQMGLQTGFSVSEIEEQL